MQRCCRTVHRLTRRIPCEVVRGRRLASPGAAAVEPAAGAGSVHVAGAVECVAAAQSAPLGTWLSFGSSSTCPTSAPPAELGHLGEMLKRMCTYPRLVQQSCIACLTFLARQPLLHGAQELLDPCPFHVHGPFHVQAHSCHSWHPCHALQHRRGEVAHTARPASSQQHKHILWDLKKRTQMLLLKHTYISLPG